MKRMALIKAGTVVTLAAWDGVQPWDPIGAGLCDTLVDVTSQPAVGPGYTYADGVFTYGALPPTPDPAGFMLAVFSDPSIPIATRNSLAPWKTAIADYIDRPGVITDAWNDLVSSLAISTANQATIHNYAVQYGIPGI